MHMFRVRLADREYSSQNAVNFILLPDFQSAECSWWAAERASDASACAPAWAPLAQRVSTSQRGPGMGVHERTSELKGLGRAGSIRFSRLLVFSKFDMTLPE